MVKSPEELVSLSGQLFKGQAQMLGLYQTLADNFYPERADFTTVRNVGTELADQLVSSSPVLMRRDLGNSLGAMLRDGDWFKIGVDDKIDLAGEQWLEWATNKYRKILYARGGNFVRSTSEGDHDYITFGQAVLSQERNRKADGILTRNWHLRDVAWCDGVDGQTECVSRKWQPTNYDLIKYFGDNVHPIIKEDVKEKPFGLTDIRHIVMPSDMYGKFEDRFPYVSCFIDVKHQHILEAVGINNKYYIVPRFQTIAGSPYAYSPATVAGLPDARTLQAMTYTLLEAGERYTRPPLLATQNVVRGDVDLSADGITWLDKEYDEKTGAGLRPLMQNTGGFPIGLGLRDDILNILSSAFYLNKITLPDLGHEMTAYETRERMKQFRRENLPLFAPIEAEYNGMLCETGFDICMRAGFFGSPHDIPKSLQGRDIVFKFESPLSLSNEEEKANQFSETSRMLAEASQMRENVADNLNFDEAFRDALKGTGAPSTWLRSKEFVESKRENTRQMQEAQMQQEGG